MTYNSQEHRYIYPGKQGEGHIFAAHSDVGYCGIKKETLKNKAGETNEKLTAVLRFRDGQELCKDCQGILKKSLAEKYGIEGWA